MSYLPTFFLLYTYIFLCQLVTVSESTILTRCQLLVGLQSQNVTDDQWTTFCDSVTNADEKIEALQSENQDMRKTIIELQNRLDRIEMTTEQVQDEFKQLKVEVIPSECEKYSKNPDYISISVANSTNKPLVVAGHDVDNSLLYVCRGSYGGKIYLGKSDMTSCWIFDGIRERWIVSGFLVLAQRDGVQLQWISRRVMNVAVSRHITGAVLDGVDHDIGRCDFVLDGRRSQIPGYVKKDSSSRNKLQITFADGGHFCEDFEYLTCVK